MFAHPNSSPGPHGGGLKRLHEDDSADLTNSGACGFGEHRNKRHHALPLRSSPLAKRSSPPPSFQPLSFTQSPHSPPRNITPVSDTEGTVNKMDGYQESFGQAQNGQGWTNQLLQSTEMDTDMGMAGVETAESTSPNHLRPGAFQPDPIAPTIAGRMPTPIQPSFAAQVRGNNWGGAAGNIMQTSSGMQHGHSQQTTSSEDTGYQGADESTPRSLNQGSMSSWNPIQNRPLPSPISESGGEDVGSPDMILDNVSHFRAQHAAAFSNMPPRSDSTMSLPSYLHDGAHDLDHHHNNTEHGSPPASGVNAMETDCPTTPSPRKGHTRSRHTLNNWTIQPGMKKSFSIGYRADCEKCRNKVPGHFNHIIVS